MHPIHPMVVHFPIALLITGVAFEALALWWPSDRLRATSRDLLLVGLLSAGLAMVTGHFAEEAVEHSGIPEQAIEIHEKLGFAAFWIFAVVLGVRLAIQWEWIPEKYALSLILGIVGVIVLLAASYFGGELVYGFGAGVAGRTGG